MINHPCIARDGFLAMVLLAMVLMSMLRCHSEFFFLFLLSP